MARLACLLLLCGFVLSGCATDDGITLGEVKKFDAYPLYYAGDEVAGNKLEKISGEEDWLRNPDQRSVGFTFIYGTCEIPEGQTDGGCSPPAQIQVSSICHRHLGLYRGRERAFDFRGAKAAGNGGGLEVFTGRTTAVIFAGGDRKMIKVVAQQLRQLGQATSPKRLPPPVPGGVHGKLPCQQKRG
jgi:hypothetical protein